jgi:hypothetical protein
LQIKHSRTKASLNVKGPIKREWLRDGNSSPYMLFAVFPDFSAFSRIWRGDLGCGKMKAPALRPPERFGGAANPPSFLSKESPS